jgi:Ca-activated chloride channel family protein
MFDFHSPYWLILIPVLIPLLIWHYAVWGRRLRAPIRYSDVARLKAVHRGAGVYLRHLPFALRLLAITLVLLALARPRSMTIYEPTYTEGVDIVIALDVSGSMLAIDLDQRNEVNRLEVSKDVISRFVDGRINDRLGLVIFASSAFTQCPMTVDYPILHQFLEQLDIGVIDENSTAIGNALANAVNRLKNSRAKSKVIVLLTDGENNAGEIDPLTAAEIAKTFGIRVYTIGAGAEGQALIPVKTVFGPRYQRVKVRIDEKTLNEIARITSGRYFRAKDKGGLENIFDEIDRLEKNENRIDRDAPL